MDTPGGQREGDAPSYRIGVRPARVPEPAAKALDAPAGLPLNGGPEPPSLRQKEALRVRPDEIRQATGIDILPRHAPRMVYRCVRCGETFGLERLLYTCPKCRSLLRVADLHFDALRERTGAEWRRVFDLRRACREPGLQGIGSLLRHHRAVGDTDRA